MASGWFINRPNNVPHYQRLFQRHDGLRQWWKTPRSAMYLYPYYALVYGTATMCAYGMVRMVLGHKTFFGKN